MRNFTPEWRKRLSLAAKKRHAEGRGFNIPPPPKGKLNKHWKGDKISYVYLHKWLRDTYPKTGVCEICGVVSKTDYANMSGEYKRDRNDFKELCRSCHGKYDNIIKNIINKRKCT